MLREAGLVPVRSVPGRRRGRGAAHTGVLARWLGWVGLAFGLVVGVLVAGSIAGLEIGPADQVVVLLVAAWLAVLAFCVGWPLPSAARREAWTE